MLYCNNCKVKISGQKKICPLCQSDLSGTAENSLEVYPVIERKKSRLSFALKIITLCAVLCIISSLAIDFITPPDGISWSKFVVLGIICAWIISFIGILKKSDILKNLFYQFFVINLLSFIWDAFTGYHFWWVSFFFPCACIAFSLAVIIISIAMRLPEKSFMFYLFTLSILELVPAVFVAKGIASAAIPAVISTAMGLLMLSALLIFKANSVLKELRKKFHL